MLMCLPDFTSPSPIRNLLRPGGHTIPATCWPERLAKYFGTIDIVLRRITKHMHGVRPGRSVDLRSTVVEDGCQTLQKARYQGNLR